MASLGVKRLLAEYRQLVNKPDPNFVAAPADMNDLFVWHFIIKGPPDTAWEGGIFHGKIVFPSEYPNAPPDIYFLTPNGRFETNKRLCLTFTSYHPEHWTTAWGVSSILTSVIAFMPTRAEGAVGGLDTSDAERRKYAIQSREWKCKECDLYLEPDPLPDPNKKKQQEEENKEENQNQEEFQGNPHTIQDGEAQNVEEEQNQQQEQPNEEQPQQENQQNEEEQLSEEEIKRRKQERVNQNILQFLNEKKAKRMEDEVEQEQKQEEVDPEEHPNEEIQQHQEEMEGKIEDDVIDFQNLDGDHNDEQLDNEPLSHNPDAQAEEPLPENSIDFQKLRETTIQTIPSFYPLLDVPIILVFLFLCFLIINSYVGFVPIFNN